MKERGVIGETPEGLLYLKNPEKYSIIAFAGKILDRWFVVMIPTATLAFIFSFLDFAIAQFFILALLFMSIGFLVDLKLHQI